MKKKRLDLMLVDKKMVKSRQRAQAIIMAGKVLINNNLVDKPGTFISEKDDIILKTDDLPYVSRGGFKLENALQSFNINAENLVCLDVGASTGGFTDCLLQNGAKKIFAIDVGYGQLAWKLRQDPRVVVIERTNIRHMPLDAIPQRIDLVTIDVSFISLRIVVPAVLKFMQKDAIIIALVKPQFEVGKERVGKGGIVRNSAFIDDVIDELVAFFSKIGLTCKPLIPSPIQGSKGNREFLIFLSSRKI